MNKIQNLTTLDVKQRINCDTHTHDTQPQKIKIMENEERLKQKRQRWKLRFFTSIWVGECVQCICTHMNDIWKVFSIESIMRLSRLLAFSMCHRCFAFQHRYQTFLSQSHSESVYANICLTKWISSRIYFFFFYLFWRIKHKHRT